MTTPLDKLIILSAAVGISVNASRLLGRSKPIHIPDERDQSRLKKAEVKRQRKNDKRNLNAIRKDDD